jgi:hypothetical protein
MIFSLGEAIVYVLGREKRLKDPLLTRIQGKE